MKKLLLLVLVSLFWTSSAFAVSWYWDLSGTDYLALGANPPVQNSGDTVFFSNDLGSNSVTGTTSHITQSLGADGILNDGDTFTEFGALAILDADNVGFLLYDRSDFPTLNIRNAYVQFTDLAGSILNYSAGGDGLDTTISNYSTAIQDDSFDLTFTPGAGTIKFYLDDDYDPTNGGNTLEIASLSLLAGEGTSPEFILNAAEGQFGIQAGFLSVLPGFWNFADDTAFEDWMAAYGFPAIIAASFNLGATVASPITDNGEDLLFGVINEGSWMITAVPEPSTFVLLGAGLLGLGFLVRRKRQ